MRYLVYGGVDVPDTVRMVKGKKALPAEWAKELTQAPREGGFNGISMG
jgi:hypothetical protein